MDLKRMKKRCPLGRSPWFLHIDILADQCQEEVNSCGNDVTLRNQY